MGYISREAWLAQQAEKQQAQQNRAKNGGKQNSGVGFFKLENGKEAIVRFAYSSEVELQPLAVHSIKNGPEGGFKMYSCIRDFRDPIDKCPLCASGNPIQQRFFCKLIEYTRDENGQIVASSKIWNAPASITNKLANLNQEYGTLRDSVYKIKRTGEGFDTTYDFFYCNPTIYNSDLYKKDFTALDNFDILGVTVKEKSADELRSLFGGEQKMTPEEISQFFSPEQTTAPRTVTY